MFYHVSEFVTMVILDPYGMNFDAVGVFGLPFHLLFKFLINLLWPWGRGVSKIRKNCWRRLWMVPMYVWQCMDGVRTFSYETIGKM